MDRRRAALVLTLAGLLVTALSLAVASARGDDASKSSDLRAALVGTWKMTSMKVDGQKNDLPDTDVTYKHVTPAGFTWLSYHKDSGEVFRAAGGTYTLAGDQYTEKVDYGVGSDFDGIKNASHTFTCRIEGDTWYHTGSLAGGLKIDEQWTRVKAGETTKKP
jgi:hypothetical protein